MSRRDTIIIAVLLNAGLLIVLFATSLKSDKVEDEPSAITVLSSNQTEEKEIVASTQTPFAPSDQIDPQHIDPKHIDRVIEQYVTPQVAAVGDQQNPDFMAAPIPEPVQEAPSQVSFREVKVKKGDVLERIARQNRVSVSEIMKANNLTSTRLKIGQVLKIPASGASKVAAVPASSGDAQYYTIKAGDNPWTIAVKHRMKVDELLRLNNMDEQKARRLKAGDKLRVK